MDRKKEDKCEKKRERMIKIIKIREEKRKL